MWRPMHSDDLPMVSAISDAVHGDYSERPETYVERLALYPAGCLMFEQAGEPSGYLLSHPWAGDLPGLDELLDALPEQAEYYYLHDIALLPSARGSGAGKAALALVADHARTLGLPDVMLVAVHGADSYWSGRGFLYVEDSAEKALRAYGPGTYFMRYGVDP